MRIFFRRILIFVLVAALFFTNINISVAASGIGKESFYQMKNEQEDTRQIENITTESQESTTAISKETTEEKEKSEQGTTEQHNEAEEKSTEQESESAGTQDKSQQQQEKLTGSELKGTVHSGAEGRRGGRVCTSSNVYSSKHKPFCNNA